MKTWDQDKYLFAWRFASLAHGKKKQCLPGSDIPYINHIGSVAMEAMAAIAGSGDVKNPDLLVQCALLHDVIEDTESTYEDVKDRFGVEVADGVQALSKDTDLPSKQEQMSDSLTRIKSQPKEVWMVKLSDRISNLMPPPDYWGREKIAAYRDEAIVILSELGEASALLANRLREKIENYQQYIDEKV